MPFQFNLPSTFNRCFPFASPLPRRRAPRRQFRFRVFAPLGPAVCAALALVALPHAKAQQASALAETTGTWQQPAEFITVVKGDTAYSLAKKYGLEVPELLALNQLSSHDLEVGQVLRVLALPPHQVAKGDTAYSIAKAHGVSVADLMAVNELDAEAHIEVGQWLTIPRPDLSGPDHSGPNNPALAFRTTRPSDGSNGSDGSSNPATITFSSSTVEAASTKGGSTSLSSTLPQSRDWRANALAMLGTPYVYGGNSENGIDCSAFVLRVFQPLGVSLPRTSAAQARTGFAIAREELSAGDLVFFDTVGGGKVTHVGIYLGNQEFVNANSYLGKVAIDNLDSKYWAPRFLSARRVLGTTMQARANSNPD